MSKIKHKRKINWKLIPEEIKIAFKDFNVKNKTLFKNDFFKNMFNVNGLIIIEKDIIEFSLFLKINPDLLNIAKEANIDNVFDDLINSASIDFLGVNLNSIKLNTYSLLENPEETSKYLIELFNFEYGELLNSYWLILLNVLNYKLMSNKSNEIEYEFLNEFWVWVESLVKSRYVNFNKWVILSNKKLYIKQKGFIK